MALLDLKSDFAFCALFKRSPNSLIDLLNSVLDFSDDKRIQGIEILPSEIPKEYPQDKLSVLDIKAISNSGELFAIEMQAFAQKHYDPRTLFYWARTYCRQLKAGEPYSHLSTTYSINFLNFNHTKNPGYRSEYVILNKDHPNILLTDKFQMIFLELPKFEKTLEKIDDNLDLWLYLIKNASSIEEKEMEMIVEKNPAMKESLAKLKRLSLNPELFSVEEARLKAEWDHNSRLDDKFQEGVEEGMGEGKREAARGMFAKGYPVEDVAEITGLSMDELKKL